MTEESNLEMLSHCQQQFSPPRNTVQCTRCFHNDELLEISENVKCPHAFQVMSCEGNRTGPSRQKITNEAMKIKILKNISRMYRISLILKYQQN